MIQTVIGINSAMMQMPDKKRKKMDYKKELQVIIDQVESAKNRLAEVTEAMDFDDKEVDSLDEAKNMRIAVMTFRLRAEWVHSLKEKRMIVKSLIARLQNKYHVSAAEVDEQDTHQIIVIGVAAIVPHNAMADSLMDDISLFIEENTEAEIIDEEREIR